MPDEPEAPTRHDGRQGGPPPRMPRQRRLATLLLLLISITLTLLAAEALFRLCAHRLAVQGEWFAAGRIMRDDDPLLGYSLTPGSSQLAVRGGAYTVRTSINALGMRDVEHPARPQAGMRRVLVLGDSFMFSPGVRIERSMPRLLEGLLPGVEVLNAGVPGYNMEQEYLYFAQRGRALQPALVVLSFFINDLSPAPAYDIARDPAGLPLSYTARPGGGRDADAPAPGMRGTVTSWLNAHSLLYVFARTRLSRAGRAAPAEPEAPAEMRALPPEVEAFRAGEPPPADWVQAWRVLDALRAETAAAHAALAVVLIPAPFQTSEAAWSDWVAWLKLPPGSLERRGPQQRMLSWCAASSTPCLDLLDVFQDQPIDRCYIAHDLHWTDQGHEMAARAVADFLRAQSLPAP